MHGRGVEGRDGSRETDTPARDVSTQSVCACVRVVPWKIARHMRRNHDFGTYIYI
jgi:hypothetical protein